MSNKFIYRGIALGLEVILKDVKLIIYNVQISNKLMKLILRHLNNITQGEIGVYIT